MKRLLQFFSRDDQDNEPIEYSALSPLVSRWRW